MQILYALPCLLASSCAMWWSYCSAHCYPASAAAWTDGEVGPLLFFSPARGRSLAAIEGICKELRKTIVAGMCGQFLGQKLKGAVGAVSGELWARCFSLALPDFARRSSLLSSAAKRKATETARGAFSDLPHSPELRRLGPSGCRVRYGRLM